MFSKYSAHIKASKISFSSTMFTFKKVLYVEEFVETAKFCKVVQLPGDSSAVHGKVGGSRDNVFLNKRKKDKYWNTDIDAQMYIWM